ncbi:urea transport system ATP-binding protein [Lipingzhangella halophila]|uniref:Urea transport system ATP-binding protein n=1 Tax=Lipingzhangella halophila TaxID=1783352 RepID=A0A7W7W587_9ACTN|nr:urea ABC transporter ATP-binding subunit UrtE [Lipingzhangella halophila]MBB4935007.1 urea transport system ATP-binding protein [Lipingzhangella halophila]
MLSVHGLSAGYGRARVLFGVDLDVADNSVTCVMGRNGVGKSTLLNTITGLITATSGQVTFDGTDITRRPAHARVRAGIGYVPQGHESFAPLTVAENLDVAWEAAGRGPRTLVDGALELFPRLVPLMGRHAGVLSGGQAQQLAIARALVTNPRLLILDEPTEGIQPSIVAEIEEAIATLHARGIAVLLVEQYLDVALRLADTVTVLDAGAVVHSAAREDLSTEQVQSLLAI